MDCGKYYRSDALFYGVEADVLNDVRFLYRM